MKRAHWLPCKSLIFSYEDKQRKEMGFTDNGKANDSGRLIMLALKQLRVGLWHTERWPVQGGCVRVFIVLKWVTFQQKSKMSGTWDDLSMALHNGTPWRRSLVDLGSESGEGNDTQHRAGELSGRGPPPLLGKDAGSGLINSYSWNNPSREKYLLS